MAKMNKRRDARRFRVTAKKTKKMNLQTVTPRGGTRL